MFTLLGSKIAVLDHFWGVFQNRDRQNGDLDEIYTLKKVVLLKYPAPGRKYRKFRIDPAVNFKIKHSICFWAPKYVHFVFFCHL